MGLAGVLKDSLNQLVIEKRAASEPFDFMVRDGKTGFPFFNIEGHTYNYDAGKHLLNISGGRLLISNEFANRLGHPAQARSIAGNISITATMYPIETLKVVNGEVRTAVMPAVGSVPGPDVVVGDLPAVHKQSPRWSRGQLCGTRRRNNFLQ